MKTLTTMILMTTVLLAVALCAQEEKESKEPKELVSARTAWQNQVKAATAPINAKYLQQLDAMKKQLGSKGDVAGATAVQKEIDRLGKTEDVQLDMPGKNKNISGSWLLSWPDGASGVYRIQEDISTAADGAIGTILREGNILFITYNSGWIQKWTPKGRNYVVESYRATVWSDKLKPHNAAIARPEKDK